MPYAYNRYFYGSMLPEQCEARAGWCRGAQAPGQNVVFLEAVSGIRIPGD